MIIGLVAGIAAGKSFVAQQLAGLTHGHVIDADQIAKDVMQEAEVHSLLRSEFGEHIFSAEGQLNRPALAKLVFGDSAESQARRQRLNAIVHPRVREKTKAMMEELRAADAGRWIVLDVPLLLEAGWDKLCDRILFIDTPLELRKQFAAGRGWSPDELEKREQAQWSLERKKNAATDRIVNSGDRATLKADLQRWVDSVRSSDFPLKPD